MTKANSLVVVGRGAAANVRLTQRKMVQRLLAGAGRLDGDYVSEKSPGCAHPDGRY